VPKAFISFAREDREVAKTLASKLAERGVDVATVDTVTTPGKGWASEVSSAVDASDLFLVVVSKASERSQWVAQETAYALSRSEVGQLRVVPVYVDTSVDPPFFLRHVVGIDFSSPEHVEGVLDRLVGSISGEPSSREASAQELQARLEHLRSEQAALLEEMSLHASRRAAWTSAISATVGVASLTVAFVAIAGAGLNHWLTEIEWTKWVASFGTGVLTALVGVLLWQWFRGRKVSRPDMQEGRHE